MWRAIQAKLDMLFSSTLNTCEKMLKLFGGCLCRWGGRKGFTWDFLGDPPLPRGKKSSENANGWAMDAHGSRRKCVAILGNARGLCKRMCIGLAGGLY